MPASGSSSTQLPKVEQTACERFLPRGTRVAAKRFGWTVPDLDLAGGLFGKAFSQKE
jgi:hypothetical protein